MVPNTDSPLGPLPEGWMLARLLDLTTKIGSGATPSGGEAAYLTVRDKYALIRSQNVFDRRFDSKNLASISSQDAHRLNGVEVQLKDILLNITGDGITFSRACMVDPTVLPARVNQHVSIIRAKEGILDPGYLLSYLTHPKIKYYMESFNAGGSRRALTKAHIESFSIPLPPIEEQRAIARILGSLDDKIEANRRMNETLEAMARTLFKSWFVDYDPVRAKAEGRAPAGMDAETAALFPDGFEEKDGRMVPRGWTIENLGDILELAYGKALKDENRKSGIIPVFGSNGQIGWHDEKLIDGPGIIVGRKGNPGVVTWSQTDFCAIDTTFYVVLKDPCKSMYYAFHLLRLQDLASLGADSAVPGLNRNLAYTNRIVIPTSRILEIFDKHVAILSSTIQSNKDQSRNLSEIRDAILPKLLSGEISIKEKEAHEMFEKIV